MSITELTVAVVGQERLGVSEGRRDKGRNDVALEADGQLDNAIVT